MEDDQGEKICPRYITNLRDRLTVNILEYPFSGSTPSSLLRPSERLFTLSELDNPDGQVVGNDIVIKWDDGQWYRSYVESRLNQSKNPRRNVYVVVYYNSAQYSKIMLFNTKYKWYLIMHKRDQRNESCI